MVICVVVGCTKRSDRDKDVTFHRIPAVHCRHGKKDFELRKKRRDGYLAAISRQNIDEHALYKYRICSRHFVSEKPASLYDSTNPSWLPTLELGHVKHGSSTVSSTESQFAVERWRRAQERERCREVEELLPAVVNKELDIIIQEELEVIAAEEIEMAKEFELLIKAEVELIAAEQIEIARQYYKPSSCNCSSEIETLQKELSESKDQIVILQEQITKYLPFNEESLENDDTTKFYTGLPNLKVVKTVFEHVSKTLPLDKITKLTPFQEFMCVLVKLRLNSPIEDLAYRFRISASTVSRILLKWLNQMDTRLKSLIMWPDRDALQKTMPACFQESFGKKVTLIIDCFEIFLERPSNLKARASTWSNYKHKNTAKVLIGITPQGVVAFVSDCWGGRVSDKYLTDHCGILQKLLPGDVVLADRGFDIAESVGMMQAKLHIPAFTRGKQQLSALEIENTRTIANVRIHV